MFGPAPMAELPAAGGPPEFILPVNGLLLVGYSEAADVFYETLREWRFHPGIDIQGEEGDPVGAAADGVVAEILENAPRNMGLTVVLEHPDGYMTVYSSLTAAAPLEIGQRVSAGDIIGTIGSSAIAEAAHPPHLHFEIHKDGVPVDPMDYFP